MSAEVKKSKFSIVNAICVLLNLGDYGKIENFITKIVTTLKREIEGYKRNKSTNGYNKKTKLAELDEKLEDAQVGVQEAYTAIDITKLSTNEAQRKFMDEYMEGISDAEYIVTQLELAKKEYLEEWDKEQKSINAEIKWREARIEKLSKG